MKLEFFAETAGGKKRMDKLIVPFIEGAKKLGIDTRIVDRDIPSKDCDIAVMYGDEGPWVNAGTLRREIVDTQKRRGKILIGIDDGAFASWQLAVHDKIVCYKVALGPPTGEGQYFNADSPADRWENLRDILSMDVKNWRETGDAILICGQADKGWSYDLPRPHRHWLEEALPEIRKHTDRPIVYRPHPKAPQSEFKYLRDYGVTVCLDQLGRNLFQVLDNEWAMVTYSSGATQDAVISGIPSFFTGKKCVAKQVCNSDYSRIENPILFDRTQWLHDYAYTTWFLDEIREGLPLKRILDRV